LDIGKAYEKKIDVIVVAQEFRVDYNSILWTGFFMKIELKSGWRQGQSPSHEAASAAPFDFC